MVRTRTPSPVTLEDPVGDRRADSVMGRDMLCAPGVFKETEKARGATPGTLRIARKTLKKKAVEHTEDVKVEGVEESVKPAPAKKRRAAPDEDEDGAEEWQTKPAARSGGTKRHRSEDKWSPSDAAALVRALGGGTWSPPDVEDAPAASNGDVPKMLYTKEDHDNINMVHIIMRRDIIERSTDRDPVQILQAPTRQGEGEPPLDLPREDRRDLPRVHGAVQEAHCAVPAHSEVRPQGAQEARCECPW
ncbi:hypothetical protein THAOC_17203 [Thalassiosira oceanica]|uniref:Uncharacterized protein n=1 Tax=Thalassiosira oceanica TaxID=159749 RepID=K0SBA8_THAOC|nr:hypothetical protein THAOC_17203 [Thalassiosira oceanica]|eukprot:EJK62194.1 hypothetical protein THAOC_17203 [Thalassiosira oceanica]